MFVVILILAEFDDTELCNCDGSLQLVRYVEGYISRYMKHAQSCLNLERHTSLQEVRSGLVTRCVSPWHKESLTRSKLISSEPATLRSSTAASHMVPVCRCELPHCEAERRGALVPLSSKEVFIHIHSQARLARRLCERVSA